jgi:F-type H+-transporting ATPase subunit delta
MKSTRQQLREARRLFRMCLVDGALDEARVRGVVQQTIKDGGSGSFNVLSRLQRLVRLNRAAHTVQVESVSPLPGDVRTRIEAGLSRMYGRGLVTSYTQNAALLGGVRITVGSDVYDGTIQGRLAALEERF